MSRSKSLAWRCFIASIVLLPLLLGFSAFMLERAFRDSLYTAERDQLLTHTFSMMSLAEPDNGFLLLPENLTDSRFNDPDSGLYAQVVDEEFGPIWQSISLTISPLLGKVPSAKVAMGSLHLSETIIDGQSFYMSRFNTVWEIEEQDREYQFVVIHSKKAEQAELQNYRQTLFGWLGGLAILLVVVQAMIIRWGLLPLGRLANEITKLEAGDIPHLDTDYPNEILPVTQNINHLLASEEQQRKRYKNTLGDLAHSLKTPLTVIRSLLEKSATAAWQTPIDEQIERMANIINHQLNRASANKATFLSSTPIKPMVDRVSKALEKVYCEKHIRFECNIAEQQTYPAQEDDLMEVLGNILDNAFKYGRQCVKLSIESHVQHLQLHVEDDGPGVPEAMRTQILERGSRVDSSLPGQGIGLAVVVDIISAYGGRIRVENSALGGAKVVLELPLT